MGSLFLGALVGVFAFQAVSSSAPPAESQERNRFAVVATTAEPTTISIETEAPGTLPGEVSPLIETPPRESRVTRVSEAEGDLPEGTTVFDVEYPGVASLDPTLLEALRSATREAREGGVTVFVTSGWRTPEYQEQLLREAVSEYGSEEEAARWVATAETSAHVSGDAVDVGSAEAQVWLAEHGFVYGLCRIYANEPWHFEFRPEAMADGCPAMYPDPTHDPRLQG